MICFRLFTLSSLRAASRTRCIAGKRSPSRIAIIAITTSTSMSFNPKRRDLMRLLLAESANRQAEMLGNEQAKIKLVATETVVEKKGRPPRPLTFLAVYCRTADPEDTADSLKTPAQAIRID